MQRTLNWETVSGRMMTEQSGKVVNSGVIVVLFDLNCRARMEILL